MKNRKYEVHAAALLFPEMSESDFASLKEDIRANGQNEPIVLWKGMLIDGRHRLRACNELGKIVDESELDESSDPMVFVISANLHRRHLETSQRGMVAARIRAHYDKEAAERKKATQAKKGGKVGDAKVVENLPPPCERAKARDKAGAALKVSGKTVDAATKVLKSGNESVIKAVDSGAMSLNKAVQVIAPPKANPSPKVTASSKTNDDDKGAKPKAADSFQLVRAYFDSRGIEDKGAIGEFCEVVLRESMPPDKVVTLLGLVRDWADQ